MCLHSSEFLDWFVGWEIYGLAEPALASKNHAQRTCVCFWVGSWAPMRASALVRWCLEELNQVNCVVLCHRSIIVWENGLLFFFFFFFVFGRKLQVGGRNLFFWTVHSPFPFHWNWGKEICIYFIRGNLTQNPPLNPRRLAFNRQNNEVHCLFEGGESGFGCVQ